MKLLRLARNSFRDNKLHFEHLLSVHSTAIASAICKFFSCNKQRVEIFDFEFDSFKCHRKFFEKILWAKRPRHQIPTNLTTGSHTLDVDKKCIITYEISLDDDLMR